MAGSGRGFFSEPHDYGAQLPGTRELLLVAPVPFQARLAWAQLPRLQLLRARESTARVRYVSFPRGSAFFAFPAHRDTTLISGGAEARHGDLIFYGSGERIHERTITESVWGLISIRVEALSLFGRTLTGNEIKPPTSAVILRPEAADR